MEIVFEILFEFFVEGSYIMAKSNKTPKLLRAFILLSITFSMIAVFYSAYVLRSDRFIMWFLITVGSVIALFLARIFISHIKGLNEYHDL